MGHTVLIAAHTAAGLGASTAGCLALTRRSYFTVYFCSLVFLVVFLAAVVAVDWTGLNTASRAVFAAFTGLGGYMIWRNCSGSGGFGAGPVVVGGEQT